MTPFNIKTSPRERIRFLQELQGIETLDAFARVTGVPLDTLKGILKRDKIGSKSAIRIAHAFGVPLNWVKSGEGNAPGPGDLAPVRSSELIEPRIIAMDPFVDAARDPMQRDRPDSVTSRLLELQDALEIETLSGLAEAAGILPAKLKAIMEGGSIEKEDAEAIAGALHISLDWLLNGTGPMQKRGAEIQGYIGLSFDEAVETVEGSLGEGPILTMGPASFALVPKAQTKLSAGGGILPEEGTTGEQYAFREQWLRSVARNIRRVILLDIEGDSMVPTLQDKDTVLIDLGRKSLREGCIYAIAIGDVVQIKRLQLIAGDRIKVISDNPTYHTYDVRADEIRIIGRLVWSGRTWV